MSCDASSNCYNFPDNCWLCRFTQNYPPGYGNNYRAIDKKIKHPVIEEEKKQQKLNSKSKKKTIQSKNVRNADKEEKRVVKSLNSGRVNNDGDLKTEDLIIDVKNQSTRIDPVIRMDEFNKVQSQAYSNKKKYGILAITNKNKSTVYVIPEEMFKEMIN